MAEKPRIPSPEESECLSRIGKALAKSKPKKILIVDDGDPKITAEAIHAVMSARVEDVGVNFYVSAPESLPPVQPAAEDEFEICEACGQKTDYAADGNRGGFLCRECVEASPDAEPASVQPAGEKCPTCWSQNPADKHCTRRLSNGSHMKHKPGDHYWCTNPWHDVKAQQQMTKRETFQAFTDSWEFKNGPASNRPYQFAKDYAAALEIFDARILPTLSMTQQCSVQTRHARVAGTCYCRCGHALYGDKHETTD